MTEGTVTTIVVVIAVLVLIAGAVWALTVKRRRLKQRFGPEYDRVVEEHDSRLSAEGELIGRERRHSRLDIRPLPQEKKELYEYEWSVVQSEFVDEPGKAVQDADRLVTTLLKDRGYPTDGYERQLEELSVEHSDVLDHYRAAHDTTERQERRQASTEELRQAMRHYHTLFDELLEDSSSGRR